MRRNVFSSAQLPKFHDSMLIVKVKDSAAPLVEASMRARAIRPATMGMGGTSVLAAASAEVAVSVASEIFTTPGLSLLEKYERGGMIKRITALAPRSAPDDFTVPVARMGISAMARNTRPQRKSRSSTANAGVSLVELERDEDTLRLQKALAEDPHVEFVSRVPVRYLLLRKPAAKTRNSPRIARAAPRRSEMWNLAKIEWARARAARSFKEANSINVAVLDTGVDVTHPDLHGRISKYVYLHPDTASVSGQKDIVGHGTHVAGTIGALINNRMGIHGICKCRLHIWKIFPDQTEYSEYDNEFAYFVDPVMYRRALADCLDEDIDVINLSIGGPGEPDHQEQQLFNALLAKGTTIVAAMGNERQEGSPTSFPAAIPGVVAVGATSLADKVTNFSNRGDHIAVCAPGKSIWSTLPTYPGQFGFEAVTGPNARPMEGKPMSRETDYDAWDGTSMASPHVAAAGALLIAKRGKIGPAAIRNELSRKSDAVAGMQGKPFDSDYGFGRLNLLRLLR